MPMIVLIEVWILKMLPAREFFGRFFQNGGGEFIMQQGRSGGHGVVRAQDVIDLARQHRMGRIHISIAPMPLDQWNFIQRRGPLKAICKEIPCPNAAAHPTVLQFLLIGSMQRRRIQPNGPRCAAQWPFGKQINHHRAKGLAPLLCKALNEPL